MEKDVIKLLGEGDPLCMQVGPELFFPLPNTPKEEIEAVKNVCRRCTLAKKCLELALEYDSEGIWGGTTTSERRRMKRDGQHLRNNNT